MAKSLLIVVTVCLTVQFYVVSSFALKKTNHGQLESLDMMIKRLIQSAKFYAPRQECLDTVSDCETHTTGHWMTQCFSAYYNQNCCAYCKAKSEIVVS